MSDKLTWADVDTARQARARAERELPRLRGKAVALLVELGSTRQGTRRWLAAADRHELVEAAVDACQHEIARAKAVEAQHAAQQAIAQKWAERAARETVATP